MRIVGPLQFWRGCKIYLKKKKKKQNVRGVGGVKSNSEYLSVFRPPHEGGLGQRSTLKNYMKGGQTYTWTLRLYEGIGLRADSLKIKLPMNIDTCQSLLNQLSCQCDSSHFLACQSLSESWPTNSKTPQGNFEMLSAEQAGLVWTFLTQQWCRSGCHSVKKRPHESSLFRHECNTKLPILHSLIHLNTDICYLFVLKPYIQVIMVIMKMCTKNTKKI